MHALECLQKYSTIKCKLKSSGDLVKLEDDEKVLKEENKCKLHRAINYLLGTKNRVGQAQFC